MRGAIAAAALLVSLPWSAAAQFACMDYAEMKRLLLFKHSERPAARGIQSERHMVELFLSDGNDGRPVGASYTLVLVTTSGMACLLGSGDDWDEIPREGH